ncbi:MAG: bifunctional UDP-N-acetylmuramoyl-tripeptide:D-alanyl-D-alanine ligase/alanine racemase, partial [Muribaculaceae bacterium]|nr:bifunctional UDP-N-acetylmuramoyl-tripeptide:D-alanyl-D-alanine ligase/alanine racemase [Muribaculaceae bacterium]
MTYTIEQIAKMARAKSVRFHNSDAVVSQLLTDSRSLTNPDVTLFFALKTHNNDGHNFITQLHSRGVRNFVVEEVDYRFEALPDTNFIIVDNSLNALQAIAAAHRSRFSTPIIAITGSRGKTAVKEWLYQLLNPFYNIVRSPRSYNSQIGVPLSLWKIDNDTTLSIIEAGISTTGEMAKLQRIINPDVGIITNIGHEHDEGFKSIEEKTREKATLFIQCGTIVGNADDELIEEIVLPQASQAQQFTWSTHEGKAQLWIKEVKQDGQGTTITCVENSQESLYHISFTSPHHIENAINCIATMRYLGIEPATIAARLTTLMPTETRISVIEGVNDCTIMVDGYASDLNSLPQAIEFMSRRTGSQRPRTLILSDLIQNSANSDEAYRQLYHTITDAGVSRFIGIGPEMKNHSEIFDGMNAVFFHSTADFLNGMSQGDFDGESILVKGNSDFAFSQIVDFLEAKQHQTVEEIDLNALAHNFSFFKSLIKPTTKTISMVKASGYGTGSYEIAKTLQDRGADYLAVAVQDEGVELRKAGISMPIIVLNPSGVNYKSMFLYNLEPEVYSLDMCKQLIKEGERCRAHNFPVHIKLDTGMHRLGFTLEQLPSLITLLASQDIIKPVSVFSHLSVADEPQQDEYTMSQFATFEKGSDMLRQAFPQHNIMRHILNTTGIVRFPQYQFEMVRIGIGL